jgi:hypothetical protein
MRRRWIGLAQPTRKRKTPWARTLREGARALGAAGVLLCAAALNFALYPDALAAVVSSEQQIAGFVPDEPAAGPDAAFLALSPLNESEVRLLAATMWAEARSEGEVGMRAVAHVIVNRIGDRFGADVRSVVRAPAQFSAWNLGDPNRPLAQHPERYATSGVNLETWEIAQRVAREVLSGQSVDPTDGALFYHTTTIRPWWSRYGEGRHEIGAHVFYRDVPDRSTRQPVITAVAARFIDGVRLDPTPAPAAEQESPTDSTVAVN